MKRKILLLLVMLSVTAWSAYSQEDPDEYTEGYIKNSVPPFNPLTRKLDERKIERMPINLYKPSPQFTPQRITSPNNLTVTDNVDVQAFPSANPQSEQHITVSKINPNNIILCSNTPYYMGYYVSQNGGTSYFGSDSMPDGLQSYGDPATSINAEGHIFFETISPTAAFKVFKSTNQGNSWPGPVDVTYSPVSFDKEMMAIDNLPASPYLNNIYTAWTDFSGTYSVRFNRSIDNGVSYQPNLNIHNSWGQGTNVQTGVNGEVYVCWANYGTGSYPANGIGFARSTNGGVSFTDLTPAFPYFGIRTGGSDPLFNNTRVSDFPSMAVDKSCNFSRGRIYIAFPSKQNGTGKSVCYVRYSDNQGSSWSDTSAVSIPSGRQNWFPWVTVDDATGTVSVAYLTFDGPSGFITNTYLAYSFDGGFSWTNIKVSDVGHTVAAIPNFATGYCGDYIGNTAWANKDYVVWNDNRTGQWQNYVSRVDFTQLALFSSNNDFNIHGPVTYTLPTASQVQYKANGSINSPVGTSCTVQPGTNVTFFAHDHVTLNPGFIAKAGCHFVAQIGNPTACVNAVQRDGVSQNIEDLKGLLKPAYDGDATIQFSMYPNPARNEITFEYLLPEQAVVTLTLMDLQGKEVMVLMNNLTREPGLNHYTADISSLTDGVYAYRLVTAGYVKAGKFVKTH
ncbi:MAG: T9SS type A sorting domain-containing protein [Bacteroidia bacterium]